MATSHVVDYELHGDDMQFVEVELDQHETVIAEAGVMMFMEDGISFEAKMGDGSTVGGGFWGALKSGAKRTLTGESLFLTHFTNRVDAKRRVAFAAPYPGRIIPIDLDEVAGTLICQRDSFLAAAKGTKIDIAMARRIGVGMLGGEGFILQRLQGDGMVFIHAGGTITEKRLTGETLRVDTGCIVAFEDSISYDIERAGNLKSMLLGGEGLYIATLKGSGRVWLQSLPFSRLSRRVLADMPVGGGAS